MNEFRSKVALELKKPHFTKDNLWRLCVIALAFGRDEADDLRTPCWLCIVNVKAVTSLKSGERKGDKHTHELLVTIIALKGAIRDFGRSPHCTANCLQRVRSRVPGATVCKSRATHRELVTCNLQCVTWYEGTAQLLTLTELRSHFFYL